ncbi:hypothetical protein TNCV_1254251 [Trichonephila clavipes]|nr:hypothetical protein TNCV_1254251 [Trichonephila clavipes]
MFSCGTFRMSKRCLHMMEKLSSFSRNLLWSPWKYRCGRLRSGWPLWHAAKSKTQSSRAGAANETETVETFELVKSAHAYAYSSGVSFPNVSVSNVIENSSYDLPYVKNSNTRNDSSSLIKDYKCNKIKITKLKLSIVREKCSDIVLCKKANGAMKTSSVEFISRSPNPLPMKSGHHRFCVAPGKFSALAVEAKGKREKSF